ncbi:YggS family pyridoxal phosphate-dependent enzyme [Roseomonas sp. NAR14]|uniref:Pyridoxal phosphate homeostasis protein n=1 Tax=Roseomonas acroporae TaxID=2937791 RepID=A0A9X1Y6Y1_9PROT|nr:YggS family pyridoxal phosphate-dependent enzyme [Roseomonas acroporae]MCK8784698.1 YggS family pyridoxal phosphate-dependent enzyme [Roseomonas acroporae]
MSLPEPAPTDASLASPAALPDVARNLALVRERIAEACARANRPAGSVTLVAVSKFHPAEAVAAALAAGQEHFGENRVQEAAGKFPPLRAAHPALRLHLIGALQTNKARDAVRVADVIESLDRPRLAAALAAAMTQDGAREAPGGGRRPRLLVQVNTGEEPQKAGVARDAARGFLRACREEHGLSPEGLMCIPPAGEDPVPHFRFLAELAAAEGLATLSMGMSGDYEAAIACGATHVRVGTAIFGAR